MKDVDGEDELLVQDLDLRPRGCGIGPPYKEE